MHGYDWLCSVIHTEYVYMIHHDTVNGSMLIMEGAQRLMKVP
jgi:hypothetical protein